MPQLRPTIMAIMASKSAQRLVLVALVLLSCVLASGCGARPSSTPIAPSTPWIASLLGSPSHMSIALRPQAFLRDPYWGPATQRAMAKPSSKPDPDDVPLAQLLPFFSAQQIEMFIVVRNFDRAIGASKEELGPDALGYAYVVRGMAVTDPMLLTTGRGERLFVPPVRLASGVLEYKPTSAYAQRKHTLGAILFIMPDGTWVGVDQGSAPRAHAIYTQTPVAPPPMALEDDALFAGFVDSTFMTGAARRAEATDPTWLRDLRGAGIVLRGGKNGAVDVMMDYTNEAAADRSKAWVASEAKASCRDHEMTCAMVKAAVRDVETTQDGARIGIRFFLSDTLLAMLSRG